MADKKLGALPNLAIPIGTDQLYVLRGSNDYRASFQALIDAAQATDITADGYLYTHDGSTAQTGVGTSFVKVTGFASEGDAEGIIISAANDQATVPADGVYDIDFWVSFSGTMLVTFIFSIHVNGLDVGEIGLERKLGTGGDVGSASCGGSLALSEDDVITVYIKADDAGKSFTPHFMGLRVHRVR